MAQKVTPLKNRPAPQSQPAPQPKAVAKPASTAVAVPEELSTMLAQDSGAGFEEATRESFAIPFLLALQDLSPQVKPKMAGYIEGAKPGMLLNTVTGELYENGVRVIPCHYSPTVIEWIPRNDGGGFVAAHPANTPLLREAVRDGAKNLLPNGHELQLTAQHFVLLIEDGAHEGALIPMKSTQLKYSRRWMSNMLAAVIEVGGKIIKPPMFAWSYRITTEEESNDQGSWWSFVIGDRERVTDTATYLEAKAFAEAMKSGAGKANYADLQAQGEPAGGDVPNDIDA